MSDEDVGRLLSLISHEVRAPVGVMRGYLRLIEQTATDLSDAHRQAITAGLRAAERAAGLLAQVSALGQLLRRETAAALTETALEPILHSAAAAVTLPSDPAITLQVGACPAVAIRADEALLRVAVTGLTTAVVRAQAHDCRIYLLAHEEMRDGRRGVTLTITTMEAVSAAHADAPLDLTRAGVGLDLPIAAFIITAHAGTVSERRDSARTVGVMVWLPLA